MQAARDFVRMLGMSRMLIALALPAACTSGMSDTSTIEQGACVALEGRRFTSVNELECGLAPDGPTSCKWTVTFTPSDPIASEFSWQYSDVGETGHASCDRASVKAMGTREIAGMFDALTQRLTWDGQVYIAQ